MLIRSMVNPVKDFILWSLLRKNALDKRIILVFANYPYKNVLDVWLTSIEKCDVKNYIVISLDEKMYNHLNENGIQTLYYNIENDFSKIMIHRTELILKVLKLGFNVIHSDADAIWSKDPQNEYFGFDNHDIVFSQGTIYPPEIHDKWGFVLCGGLFGIKSTLATRRLLADVIKDVKKSRNDQKSFNTIIYQNGIDWSIDNTYELQFRERVVKCSNNAISGKSKNYSILLLPHRLFQRLEEDCNDVYVRHWLLNREKLISNELEGTKY